MGIISLIFAVFDDRLFDGGTPLCLVGHTSLGGERLISNSLS